MAENLGMEVTVGADVKPLEKGLNDAKKALASTAAAAAKTDSSLDKLSSGSKQATNALTNLGRVAQDAPFGFISIANNLNPLLESFQRLKAETGSAGASLKALGASLLGPAGVGVALSVVSSILITFGPAIRDFIKNVTFAEKAQKELNQTLTEAQSSVQGNITRLQILVGIARDLNKSDAERQQAIKTLNKEYDVFNGKLTINNINTQSSIDLINKQTDALVRQAKIRGLQELISKTAQKNAEVATRELSENLGIWDNIKAGILGAIDPVTGQRFAIDEALESRNKTLKQGEAVLGAYKVALQKLLSEEAEAGTLFKDKPLKPQRIKIDKPGKVDIDVQTFRKIQDDLFDGVNRQTGKGLQPTLVLKPQIKFDIDPKQAKKVLDGIQALINAQAVQDILDRTFNSAISNVADSFAGILTGAQNGFSNLFDGLASTLATGLKEIGKYLVQTYLLIGTIQKIKFSNPAVGVAVGFALQVLGALIQTKIKSTKAFATGVRNFEGGVALVGERGPELVNLPRGAGVVPNNELNAYGGGAAAVYIPALTLRGADLVIAFNRAQQQMRRSG